ncbi:MAG: methyltransferase domain-containing protein [Deltaproteobacteria bacterium]|nr:methyltransferase domain-containing protein [Deltaproteobacteria bacterium]
MAILSTRKPFPKPVLSGHPAFVPFLSHHPVVRRWHERRFAAVTRHLDPYAETLAAGADAAIVVDRQLKVTALDDNPDHLRLLAPYATRCVAGRAEELPFENEGFDAVVILRAPEEGRGARILAEAARVLRPGGTLIASVLDFDAPGTRRMHNWPFASVLRAAHRVSDAAERFAGTIPGRLMIAAAVSNQPSRSWTDAGALARWEPRRPITSVRDAAAGYLDFHNRSAPALACALGLEREVRRVRNPYNLDLMLDELAAAGLRFVSREMIFDAEMVIVATKVRPGERIESDETPPISRKIRHLTS